MPVNSNDPLFLAAEVFRDTLLEVGICEAVAERTRAAFYALRQDEEEETVQKITRIASQVALGGTGPDSSMMFQANRRGGAEQAMEENKEATISAEISSLDRVVEEAKGDRDTHTVDYDQSDVEQGNSSGENPEREAAREKAEP